MDRLTLDYTHVLEAAVGPDHGLTASDLEGISAQAEAGMKAVQARRGTDLRWMDLPHQDGVQQDVLDYAGSMQPLFASGQLENVVVLGIGGSALGNRALHAALSSPFHDISPPKGMHRLRDQRRVTARSRSRVRPPRP